MKTRALHWLLAGLVAVAAAVLLPRFSDATPATTALLVLVLPGLLLLVGEAARAGRRRSSLLLGAGLAGLAVLYALRFFGGEHALAALLVFVLPPLLLLLGVARGRPRAAFWSGVLGLLWFSHGIMEAWSEPHLRVFAWTEIVLALVVIVASSWPGLAARFGRRRERR